MEDSSMDMLVLRAYEFGFAFNDIVFSDRILRLEIIPALASNSNPGGERYLNWFESIHDDSDSECATAGCTIKTLHVSSPILAAKSPFFYKLFKNGMRESQQRDAVTLRINATEEAALMDLLNFIYGIPLNATSAYDLLDVLMAADKFEVTTCMRYCIQLLLKLPMSLDSAPFCLELPLSVLVSELVQPLIDAAKQFLAVHFRDFTKSQEEAMALPLCAVEVVLGSDRLRVNSEDVVFDFILEWSRIHYPNLEERREILTKHLARFICFRYMSCLKLKEIVDCPDFEYEEVSKLVLKALLSKVEDPYGHHIHASKDLATTKFGFPRRVYNHRLIKVVQFEYAQPSCGVYFDLKKEECADLLPAMRLYSQAFCLGGHRFSLLAQCIKEERKSFPQFGLFVEMTGSESCKLEYEFAVRKKRSIGFQSQFRANQILTETEKAKGTRDLFGIPWNDLMSDYSMYFIDGILHLKIQCTIIN